MKKLVNTVLILVIVLCLSFQVQAAGIVEEGACGESAGYTLYDDGLLVTSDVPGVSGGANASRVIDTLTLYGFSREQIRDAMRSVSPSLPLEEMIAETLRILASKR